MAVYLVAYDRRADDNVACAEFHHGLEALGAQPILSSVFVVASSSDAQSLHLYLKDFIDPEDRILVSRLTEDFSGYVLQEAGPWLAQHKPL